MPRRLTPTNSTSQWRVQLHSYPAFFYLLTEYGNVNALAYLVFVEGKCHSWRIIIIYLWEVFASSYRNVLCNGIKRRAA